MEILKRMWTLLLIVILHSYSLSRANILLDQHLTAKLGDFGFTREFPQVIGGRTMITAPVVAKSLGYCPPEMDTCHLSPKSDVFSYGVVS